MCQHTYVLKELPSRNILHDHEDRGGCGDDFIQLDNVRLAKQFEDLYFTSSTNKGKRRKKQKGKGEMKEQKEKRKREDMMR